MYDARVMRVMRTALACAAALLAAAPASAWTASTRVQIVDDAIKLMPPTLRGVLEARRDSVCRGMLDPMTREDAPPHRPPWENGTLVGSVEASARDLVDGVDRQVDFRDVARRFGVLAHYVADAAFPPAAAAGGSDDARYAHFGAYVASRRPKFPLVFYGHDNPTLAQGDFRAFATGVLDRSRREDVNLARAYAAAPSWNDPVAFDDRSVPFAVASLSYSRAVTDIVQAWLAVWRQCHGDLSGTPYAGGAPR